MNKKLDKRDVKEDVISFVLTEEMNDNLERLKNKTDRTKSWIIRKAIKNYLYKELGGKKE